jgi:cardiolipin synthase
LLCSCSNLFNNLRNSSEQRSPKPNAGMSTGSLGMSLVRGTTLSMVRQPVTTSTLGLAVMWQRPRELLSANLPLSPNFTPTPGVQPGSAEFEKLLDEQDIPSPEMGKITWLVDGKRFFPEFEKQIAAARSTIDVQVFIFDNDDIAVRYAEHLKRRSHHVPTRVLFDDLGSVMAWKSPPETPMPSGFKPPTSMAKYFREGSQVQVRRMLNPWMVCDHSKLHVFDHRVAIMGCMNIGREYHSEWHDLMFRVEGPVVARLQEDFNRSWHHAGPAGIFSVFKKEPTPIQPPAVAGQIPVRVIRTDPAAGRNEIRKSMLLAIRAARERIWIENPYIANDDVVEELEEAARRGVDVRVVIPSKNDSTIMDVGNKAFANKLLKAGGKAYEYPGMTHMKVMICDGWACVGSANLDTLSLRINRELNLTFNDPAEVNRLIQQVFTPDFRVAKRRTLKDDVSPTAPLAEAVADQL